VTQPGLLKWK